MVDNPHYHKQRPLEHGMIEQMEHRSNGGFGEENGFNRIGVEGSCGAQTKQAHHETQLADGGISQQGLQIRLADSLHRTVQERNQPHGGDDPEPFTLPGKNRRKPGHQIQAGLHHSGGVQISTHRSRRLHGIRQPDMEGELGRLGEGPQENKNHGGDKEGMSGNIA
ncbi:hypothetical protein D3C75_564740 [compost metagenome]